MSDGPDLGWTTTYLMGLRLARAGTLAGVCEFDWFAVDLDGRLAVFETASFGFHPPAELLPTDADYIDAMREVHAAEGVGWDDHDAEPKYGHFYVYDWRIPTWETQHYSRIRLPVAVGTDGLDVVRSIAVLVDGRFSGIASLTQPPLWRRPSGQPAR